MMCFPPQAVESIRSTISSIWPGGIQRERDYYGSHEFKLKGYPWSAQGVEAVTSRHLMSRMLGELFMQGWVLNLTTDISKSPSDLDTLLFRHQYPAPAPCEWMAISFSNSDQIRFITDPHRPWDAVSAVINAYIGLLGAAVQRHEPHRVAGCYEVKLKGNPWRAYSGETMHARSLLLNLLTTLEQFGWTVYASVDQKLQAGGNSQSGDTDTWHCCRPLGWEPGMPVFHS